MCPLPSRAHFRRPLADPGRRPGAKACLTSSTSSPRKESPGSTPTSPGEGRKNFCVYDGPHAKAVRAAAERNGLPVDPQSGAS
jgi:hypothetical protein